jgi:hypothetical protein
VSLLTQPYITAPEFRASPTWLDTRNLIQGGTGAAQDAELVNVLLRASAWASSECGQRLDAHAATERLRVEPDSAGRVSIHAAVQPVRQVSALSYGQPGALTPVADLSTVWVEDAVQIIAALGTQTWPGLEFGSTPRPGVTFVQLGYVGGHTSTALAAPTAAGAATITVADPTGVYPGDVLRLWDPGAEEAVTVAAGYVPGTAAVTLAAPTAAAHPAGTGVSALPADVHQAVVLKAASMLLREPTAGAGDWPEAAYEPTAQASGRRTRMGELAAEACALLRPFRRVR